MAFTPHTFYKNGSCVNNNAPFIWSYRSGDTMAVIMASGYFNQYIADLTVGDAIFINAMDGTKWIVVSSTTTNVTTGVLSS